MDSLSPSYREEDALRALLHWYVDMGVDNCVALEPADYGADFSDQQPVSASSAAPPSFASPSPSTATPSRPGPVSQKPTSKVAAKPNTGVIRPDAQHLSPDQALEEARKLAAGAHDIPALEQALRQFDGCLLKKGARHTVFADGIAGAPLLVMGEAPGRDEDREGKPFVGRAGMLLDRMLAAIGHSRQENAYISNVIYWRPPGNRTPTPEEMMICHPFSERLIELAQPKVVMIAGATPLKALLNKTGIMKTRGKWQTLTTANGVEVPVMPTFHPAYLLRNPAAKRLVWQDLQALARTLREI